MLVVHGAVQIAYMCAACRVVNVASHCLLATRLVQGESIITLKKSNKKSITTFLNVDRSDPQGLRRSAVGSLRTLAAFRRHAPFGNAKRGSRRCHNDESVRVLSR